uniref:Multidrug resistance-associated protein 4 n=1 Tax=Catagonus wagneri TaxID=51154 RepID=A0A8C3W8H5_9CETA
RSSRRGAAETNPTRNHEVVVWIHLTPFLLIFNRWLNPLFKIGYKRRLEEDDMYSVLPEDGSERLGEEHWDREVSRAKKDAQEPSLMKAIVKCYWKPYLVLGIFTFFEVKIVQPILLGKIISYVEYYDPSDSATFHEALAYAAGLSVCVLTWAFLHHVYFYHIQRVGMRLRVAVCHMIYRKALRLSNLAMRETNTGQIVNLLSNDVNRFDQVTMSLHFLWAGPLQAVAVTALLWMEVGRSCLAGMAVLILLLLLQSCIGKWFSSLRSKTAAHTDNRIRTVSEIITGIRTVKMYTWEKSFTELITRLRRKEISKILRSSYLKGLNLASFFAVSKIMIFVTFITSEVLENVITASQVFVVVTLFEALRWTGTLHFPTAVEMVSEAVVSVQRVKCLTPVCPLLCISLASSKGWATLDLYGETSYGIQERKHPSPDISPFSRAVYQDADIYLLDDPLSAVDAGVGRCICRALHEKITILVTHQLQYLKDASQILILKDGKIMKKGTHAEFPKPGVDFEGIHLKESEEAEPSPVPDSPTRSSQPPESSVPSPGSPRRLLDDAAPEDQDTEIIQVTLSLESYSEGKVGFKTYKDYFTAGAHWHIIIFLFLINIAAQVNTDIYLVLTVGTVLFGITKSLLMFYVLVNSSQTLHQQMLESILRVPVLFFDRNPAGRILNRFCKDTGHMDDLLPQIFQDFLQTFFLVMGVVGVMVAVIPWTAIPLIPLGIIVFVLRRYFLATSRDVKRLECATRSPVFSHLASSLQGRGTIRAFKAQQRFQELFDAHQDLHSEAWFLFLTTSRWFALCLDAICAVFVTVVAFGSLFLAEAVNVGQVGLVLSLALTFMVMVPWCIRQSAEAEDMMISVERVIEYTHLEKEAPWEYEYRPPPSWPNRGEIGVFKVSFRYSSDGPLVLKELTRWILSRRKVGVVGRTGAGKSSLVSALFRLSEPQGEILIDGISTLSIGLHDLRKNVSVVPQEPVLFTGTMRKNLDPFNEHTDRELWNALEEVQLKEAIEGLPGKMNTELAESGSNLSAGQRQLVSFARAILRKNQILIIDKATSNVDPRTDEFIKKNIREKFAQCTVLTITNRLSTIIDSESVMVLDSGRQIEYNQPYQLLQNRNSLFSKMVQQVGEAEASALTETAKQVSFKQRIVVKVHFCGSLFRISMRV